MAILKVAQPRQVQLYHFWLLKHLVDILLSWYCWDACKKIAVTSAVSNLTLWLCVPVLARVVVTKHLDGFDTWIGLQRLDISLINPLTYTPVKMSLNLYGWSNTVSKVDKYFSVHTPRFTSLMPSGWVFILFCVLLRMTEGVGSAMLTTAAFALLPELFPNHVGTLMVCTSLSLLWSWLMSPLV